LAFALLALGKNFKPLDKIIERMEALSFEIARDPEKLLNIGYVLAAEGESGNDSVPAGLEHDLLDKKGYREPVGELQVPGENLYRPEQPGVASPRRVAPRLGPEGRLVFTRNLEQTGVGD